MSYQPGGSNYLPLQYATPGDGPRRPGVLTAVCIFSIIVGSFSALVSYGMIRRGMSFMRMSSQYGNLSRSGPLQARFFAFHVDLGASLLTIGEAGISGCMAVMLIGAGAMAMRNWPMAWRLHRIFALVKIPSAAIAAIAICWTEACIRHSLMDINARNGVTANNVGYDTTRVLQLGSIWLAIGLVYPIAILIVMSRRASREYLGAIRAGA